MASGQAAPQPSGDPASASALETAIKHGGNAGGKPRGDGLVPGSPQAAAADREKDRIRKQASRAVAQQLRPEPAALPSALPGATMAPAPGESAVPGAGQAATPFVPWDPSTIKPLVEKMMEAAEQGRLAKFAAKTQQLGDMPKLIKEIQDDAHFPPEAKAMLSISLPRMAAKWLNKSGLSAEYQDEIACGTAVLLIVQHNRKIDQKLDKLIAAATKAKEPKREPEQQIFGAAPASHTGGKTATPNKEAPAVAAPAPQLIATVKQ